MKPTLPTWDIKNKRVLLRADLNVPLLHKKIVDDFRLQNLLPAIDYLLKHGSTVVIMTHIGRPKKHDPALSTKTLIPWFKKRGYNIIFEDDINNAYQKSKTVKNQIILLENMRFFPSDNDYDTSLAKKLARLGDFYVNDSFGTLHRSDISEVLVPQEFPPDKRSIGFLVEKELKNLAQFLDHPKQPFVLILGGNKLADKIHLIQHFLHILDTILLCPAIVFTFLKAIGKPVGNSLVDNQMLETCKTVLKNAKKHAVSIMFPIDFQVEQENNNGPLAIVSSNTIGPNDVGISIGPKTMQLWKPIIKQAGTVFFNGSIGFINRSETLQGMKVILETMAESRGTTIIAGGDSVATTRQLGFQDKIDFLSTGGGATLAYLGGAKLPGLTAINTQWKIINKKDKN